MAGIVFDAGVLVALYDDADFHHPWSLKLFSTVQDFDFLMSTINFAEVLVKPQRSNLLQKFVSSTERLGIHIVPIASSDAFNLASVRAATNLRMSDAVVLQTALDHSAAIATTDSKLANAARELQIPVYQP